MSATAPSPTVVPQHPRFHELYATCHKERHASPPGSCLLVHYFEFSGDRRCDVWPLLADFAAAKKYQPLVESCMAAGGRRVLKMCAAAAPLVAMTEVLTSCDEKKGVMTWVGEETEGFPFRTCRTVLSVHNLESRKRSRKSTVLIWSCSFQPISEEDCEAAKMQVTNYIQICGGSLKTLFW